MVSESISQNQKQVKKGEETAKKLLATSSDEETRINALWTLYLLSEYSGTKVGEKFVIEAATKYCMDPKRDVKVPAIRILGNICAESQEEVEKVIAAGGLKALATELETEDRPGIVMDLCWAMSNISCGPSCNIAKLLQLGVIHKLCDLVLTSGDHKVWLFYSLV